MTALVVGSSALLLLIAVVTLAAHDIVGKAKQYEAYVVALSNRAAAAHASATASLANSKLASQVGRTGGDLLATSMQDFSLGSVAVNVTQRLLSSFAEWLSNALLVIIFVIYLLEGQRKRPASARAQNTLISRIQGRIQRYMTIKLLLSLGNGMLAWLIYSLLGLDLAIAFGFIHFVLNFIPSVGPLVATLIPLPVVLVDPKLQAMEVLLTIALPTTTHLLIGHFLEPKLMGDSLELHPITVLLCLIFWGMIWGVPGMLLAAPMTAAAKLVFESIAVTLPFAQLLAGQPIGDDGADTDLESGPNTPATGLPKAGAGGQGEEHEQEMLRLGPGGNGRGERALSPGRAHSASFSAADAVDKGAAASAPGGYSSMLSAMLGGTAAARRDKSAAD